jgi:capsule polysaccharide export protein KpsE/RkpR
MNNNTNPKKKELTVLDYINILKSNKKIILIITFVLTVISVIVAFFVIPPIYQSVAVIKTANSKSSGLSSLLGAGSAGFSELADIGEIAGGGGSSKELALYENILGSRRNLEEVITRFKLNDDWEYKYMQDAIKYFKTSILEVSKDKLAGTLTIGIFDKDPQRAKEIADYMILQLNKINIELNVQNAKNNREFIEQRYTLARSELKKAEDSLKSYQDDYGIAPDMQAKVSTEVEIKLESEIKTEEVKLDLLKKLISPDQTEVKIQEEKISSLKKQLEGINESDYNGYGMLNLKNKPTIILNYFRLVREVEIQNKILTFLLPLFEQAKIEENRQTPTILIIDYPYVPERKAKPKRIYIILATLFVSFFGTFSFFVVKEKWDYYKSQDSIKI